jgi:hypothetical protein
MSDLPGERAEILTKLKERLVSDLKKEAKMLYGEVQSQEIKRDRGLKSEIDS